MAKDNYLKVFLESKLKNFYFSITVRMFAISLIAVFIPIYLLNLNYSLKEVLLFFSLSYLISSLTVYFGIKLSVKKGTIYSLGLSIPLIITFYFLLYTLKTYNWPLYLLSLFLGLNSGFYWPAYHVYFSKSQNNNHSGKELALMDFFSFSLRLLAPVTGGLIIYFAGFKVLFGIVMVVLFLSLMPLFKSKEVILDHEISIIEAFKTPSKKDYFAFLSEGIEPVLGTVIWPIFIFFAILNSYISLGFVTSLSILFSMIFILLVGKLFDKNNKLLLKISSFSNSFIWIIRFFVKTSFQIYLTDSFYGFSRRALLLSFNSLTYKKANKGDIYNYFIAREISITFFRSLFLFSLIFISNLEYSFLIGSMGSLLYLFL